MSEVEVVRLSSKGQVVIPKPIRGELGLKEGDRLLAYAKGGLLVMRKVEKEESLLSVLASGSRKKVASLKLNRREVDRAIEGTRKGSKKEA
jgi:AbrB family looped-hinge helix DNA binding protein